MRKYPKEKMYTKILQWRSFQKFILQKQKNVSQSEYQEFEKPCLYSQWIYRGEGLRNSSSQNSM